MNNDEQTYVSVKEFAAITGKSTQAIYRKFKAPSMLKFVKSKKGRKLISTTALDLFNIQKVDRVNTIDNVDQSIKKDLQNNGILPTDIGWALDIFTAQLAVKDVQIAAQNTQLSELNERLKEANQLLQKQPVIINNQG